MQISPSLLRTTKQRVPCTCSQNPWTLIQKKSHLVGYEKLILQQQTRFRKSLLFSCLVSYSTQFLIRLFDFLLLYEFFVYFGYYPTAPYQIYDLELFYPIQKVAFSFCWWFPFLCRSFLLCCVPLVYFCFCYFCFCCQIKKIITKTYINELTSSVFY